MVVGRSSELFRTFRARDYESIDRSIEWLREYAPFPSGEVFEEEVDVRGLDKLGLQKYLSTVKEAVDDTIAVWHEELRGGEEESIPLEDRVKFTDLSKIQRISYSLGRLLKKLQ